MRLDKVCSMWDDLDQTYDKQVAMGKFPKGFPRIEFLKKITLYSGKVEDDLTKFKSMFANEIRNYDAEQLKRYEDLMMKVEEILEILTLCVPAAGSKNAVFEVDDDLTIKEIIELIQQFFKKSTEDLSQMSLFNEEPVLGKSVSESEFGEGFGERESGAGLPDKAGFEIDTSGIEISRKDYNVVITEEKNPIEDLFSMGKISNYYEIVDGKVNAINVDCCSDRYVYINNRAAFFNFIHKFSQMKKPSEFYKAIYLVLVNSYVNEKSKPDAGFKFPYVFIRRNLTKETKQSFTIGNVVFRKKNAKQLSADSVKFRDMSNREFTNTENILFLNIKNNEIQYRVCIIG